MGFVAPLVLLGLGALAVPIFVHHIQRERKRVVEFPSLMFLRRIPYQSVRRRRIRDVLLLLMRLAALALIVFHVLDPAEIEFTYDDASAFEDLESGEQIPVVPEALADQYRTLVRENSEALRSKWSELRIDYALLNTSSPLDHALFSYLSMREQLSRVR